MDPKGSETGNVFDLGYFGVFNTPYQYLRAPQRQATGEGGQKPTEAQNPADSVHRPPLGES